MGFAIAILVMVSYNDLMEATIQKMLDSAANTILNSRLRRFGGRRPRNLLLQINYGASASIQSHVASLGGNKVSGSSLQCPHCGRGHNPHKICGCPESLGEAAAFAAMIPKAQAPANITAIHLVTEMPYIVVKVEVGGIWYEVIKEYHDWPISHIVEQSTLDSLVGTSPRTLSDPLERKPA